MMRQPRPASAWLTALVAALLLGSPWVPGAGAADYAGPLIDAHSHLPSAAAIDAYVAAMKRHDVSKVVLLGVGGLQKNDPALIASATRKYPDRVVPGVPLADPTRDDAAGTLEAALRKIDARAIGEVHLRQVGRRTVDRDPGHPAFGRVLELAAARRLPVVIHFELTDAAAQSLDRALAAHRTATVVLAHAGEGPPVRLDWLLDRNPNLMADLSGMHFQRRPALATEEGPLDPGWKALIEKYPDRFLMGLDVWAARLFEPAMLDRLLGWTRRILGELQPDAAERVAWRNAAALYGLR
jgi:predicted TIM-barrel fold metal-dependent hydrolase